MKIALVINDIETEKDNYTSIRMARRALELGHAVSIVGVADFSYETDGSVMGRARVPSSENYKTDRELLDDLQDPAARTEWVCLSEQDVLLLRFDPADEITHRPWAPTSAHLFAQIAAKAQVIVLNDPSHLTDASNKTYFQQYPESTRPRTVITRDEEAIKRFIEAEDGRVVIKPLQGSGGHGVFILRDGSSTNVNQIIEATLRDGYAIVQEYLPKAADGDLRLITLNGEPLCVNGTYACVRRFSETEDARSNISVGGSVELVTPDDDALKLAETCGPKLKRDGMYLAGLDIVGDKMMEINVDSPGGLTQMEELSGEDFSGAIIRDLERKVRLRDEHGSSLSMSELARI